jgi:hypothetical protein
VRNSIPVIGVTSGSYRDDDETREEEEGDTEFSPDLEDGTLDPDELHGEPDPWDEGSDDET